MKRVLSLIALLVFALACAGPAWAGTPAAPARTSKPAAKAALAKSGARLDDVHIKGEIPEPQVLFVVGRERRRFLDFQHRRYLEARAHAAAPEWTRVVDPGNP